MEAEDDAHGPPVFRDDVEDLQGLGMDVDAELGGFATDDDAGGGDGRTRKLEEVQGGAGHSGEGCLDLRLRGRTRTDDAEAVVRAVEPTFDLRLEEVDRAGEGEPDNERDAEEAGVEVPAPDGAIVQPGGSIGSELH